MTQKPQRSTNKRPYLKYLERENAREIKCQPYFVGLKNI